MHILWEILFDKVDTQFNWVLLKNIPICLVIGVEQTDFNIFQVWWKCKQQKLLNFLLACAVLSQLVKLIKLKTGNLNLYHCRDHATTHTGGGGFSCWDTPHQRQPRRDHRGGLRHSVKVRRCPGGLPGRSGGQRRETAARGPDHWDKWSRHDLRYTYSGQSSTENSQTENGKIFLSREY